MRSIQIKVDALGERAAKATLPFVTSRFGKVFLSIVLLGPLTFIPTVYQAWFATDISALRTLTWPLMILVNTSAFLSVIHNGDWRMRLVSFVWILMMAAVFLATLVR